MTPVMRDGKSLAVVDIGVPFGKEFVDRAKQRFGIDIAVYWRENEQFKRLSSTFGDEIVATQDELKSVFSGTTLNRDATLGGRASALFAGTNSDSLIAVDSATLKISVLRVPYPLGFHTRGMDGRIDDVAKGWKGKGIYATYASQPVWHRVQRGQRGDEHRGAEPQVSHARHHGTR